MRVGINLLYLLPGIVGGSATYAVSLIKAMTALEPGHDYFVFLNEESRDLDLGSARSLQRIVLPIRAHRRGVRYAWEQTVLPLRARRMRLDVLHSPGYVGPFYPPCAHVLSVLDLNFVALGDAMPRHKRLLLRFAVGQSVKGATEILTLSESSRRQILDFYALPGDRVTVTHLAGRDNPETAPPRAAETSAKYRLPQKYVVAFSSLSPHKNIPRLIRAFAQIKDRIPHSLVLLGHLPPGLPLQREIESLGVHDRIVATGFVPDEDVLPLIHEAELFVLPSLYEGFGLPILDAQGQSVAVACSTFGSIPEVAGTGAAYFSPTSVNEMSRVILLVLSDEDLRSDLIRRGEANRRRFSWTRTARITLDAYDRARSRKMPAR